MKLGTSAVAALLLAATAALWTAPAQSAMYRCGKTFQDRPCDNVSQEQRLTPGGRLIKDPAPSTAPMTAASAAAPAGPSPYAAACRRLGDEAQRVTWKREAGATREQQLANPPTSGSREEMLQLIEAVYARRGSAPEVKAAIEAECVAERQRAADAAAAAAAAAAKPASSPSAAPATPASAPAQPAASAATVKPAEALDPALCASHKRQLEEVHAQLRKGGDVKTMESLQNRRRNIDQAMRQARCL